MNNTEGPWKREANTIVKRKQDGSLAMNIIGMTQVQYREQGQEAVANLRLIAAAPDMLDALFMVKQYLQLGEFYHSKVDVYKAVTDAVSLATKG